MINLKDILGTLKKHAKNIIIFLVLINIIALSSFGVVFNAHVHYIDKQLENNIMEYLEVDKEQLCKIVGCTAVIDLENQNCLVPNKKGHLKVVKFNKPAIKRINEKLFIINNESLAVYNKGSHSYYIINTSDMLSDYKEVALYFLPIIFFAYLIPLYSSIKREKEEGLLLTAGSEALLANKSMINITENIHHELNTPLEVIDNKVEKIHGILSKFLVEEYEAIGHIDTIPEDRILRNKRLVKLNEDFEFIKTASEQIYAVLEKMKGFKHLRYSNGNKSFKNIIDGGFKIINISNTNFEYKVDKELAKFSINSKNLVNADFLSIILNHIKNSLEANASKIFILYTKFDGNFVYIRIIDNGNGIPDSAKKKIFMPNFSTKISDTGIRGNGMYLNKHILNAAGGDIRLISTSKKGTTIELKVPAKLKKRG